MGNGVRRGGLVGPIILIGIGVIFLLNNLGVTSVNLWELVIRLWPILLIGWGLDILIGRRSLALSLGVLGVTLALVAGGVWWVATRAGIGEPVTGEQIRQALQGATQADVEIEFGAGGLRLGPLASGANLIEGTIALDSGERAEQDFLVEGGTAVYRLRTSRVSIFPFSNRGDIEWDLRLNEDVPTDLDVSTGVGESDLNLERMNLTDLRVSTGVGRTTVRLPARGEFSVKIDGGVGEVIVWLPKGLEARIHVDTGLGNFNAPSGFAQEGDDYVSPGYDEADNRVDIDIDAGIGNIEVRLAGS